MDRILDRSQTLTMIGHLAVTAMDRVAWDKETPPTRTDIVEAVRDLSAAVAGLMTVVSEMAEAPPAIKPDRPDDWERLVGFKGRPGARPVEVEVAIDRDDRPARPMFAATADVPDEPQIPGGDEEPIRDAAAELVAGFAREPDQVVHRHHCRDCRQEWSTSTARDRVRDDCPFCQSLNTRKGVLPVATAGRAS